MSIRVCMECGKRRPRLDGFCSDRCKEVHKKRMKSAIEMSKTAKRLRKKDLRFFKAPIDSDEEILRNGG